MKAGAKMLAMKSQEKRRLHEKLKKMLSPGTDTKDKGRKWKTYHETR